MTPEMREVLDQIGKSAPPAISIDCPDKITEIIHSSILDFIDTGFKNARRAAVLLAHHAADGVLAGTYRPEPFPIHPSIIDIVEYGDDPKFINDTRTVCCVALPSPHKGFLYVE